MGVNKKTKTEHSGAKKGQGAWDIKATAKYYAKKLRRQFSKREVEDGRRRAEENDRKN